MTAMASRYKIIKELGRGGFGAAYLASLVANRGQLVVIKEMHMKDMSSSEAQSARKEAEFLEALDHPNITKYIDYFEEGRKLCIVMEYADGGDLQQLLNRHKDNGTFMDEDEALGYFVQICLGLKHIHDKSIVHRDIKSPNVFLTKDGLVKLGDFGVAKTLDHTAAMAQTQIGTPYYLSPEIVAGEQYNRKTDIWSLGVLLYEMLALKLPFTGSNLAVLINRIGRGVFQPLPNRYSPGLRELVSRMLRQVPLERPTIRQILLSPIIRGRLVSMVGTLNTRTIGQALPTASTHIGEEKQEDVSESKQQDDVQGDIVPHTPVYKVDLSGQASDAESLPQGGGGAAFGQGAAFAAERARRLAAAVAERQDIARARRAAARAEQQAEQAAAAQRWAAHEAREREAAAAQRAAWLAREKHREAELEARAAVASMAEARRRAAEQQQFQQRAADGSMAGRLAARARQSEWEERRAVAERARMRAENGGGAPRSDRGGGHAPVSASHAHDAAAQAEAQRRHREQQRARAQSDREAALRNAAREAFFENKAIAARAAARANDQLGRQAASPSPFDQPEAATHSASPERVGGADRVREVQARRAAAKEAERAAHERAVRAAIAEQHAERVKLHQKRLSAEVVPTAVDTEAAPDPHSDGKCAPECETLDAGNDSGGAADGEGASADPQAVLRALEEARAAYRLEKQRAEARAAAALLQQDPAGADSGGGGVDDRAGAGDSPSRRGSVGDVIVIPAGPLKARRKPPKLGAGKKRGSGKSKKQETTGGKADAADSHAPSMATGPLQEAAARQLARVKAQPKRKSSRSKAQHKPSAAGSTTPTGAAASGRGDADLAEEHVIELEVAVDGMRDELEAILAEAEGASGDDAQRLLDAAGHDYDDTPPPLAATYGVLGDDGDDTAAEGQSSGQSTPQGQASPAVHAAGSRHGSLPPLPEPPSLSRTTSTGQDVERLRLYLEEYMGEVPFVKAYTAVRGCRATGGSVQEAVGAVLSSGGGRSGAASSALSGRFSDLILRLIALEDSMMAQQNA